MRRLSEHPQVRGVVVSDEAYQVPLKWRRSSPKPRSSGTLYEFIRTYLCNRGGECNRVEILEAIQTDSIMAARLEDSQGLPRLLRNMQLSGWITLLGQRVFATSKTLRRSPNFGKGVER